MHSYCETKQVYFVYVLRWHYTVPQATVYSGTSLIWTPLGPKWLSWLVKCPCFKERIICIYIKSGLSQVSWLSKVSLFQRCPLREVPLYIFAGHFLLAIMLMKFATQIVCMWIRDHCMSGMHKRNLANGLYVSYNRLPNHWRQSHSNFNDELVSPFYQW